MVEVLVAALLIFLSLGGIFAMNARSMHILRSTRQVTASSLIAQQRLESIRSRPWPEISRSAGLARMLETPTESESELADAEAIETVSIMVPPLAGEMSPGGSSIRVQRERGQVRVRQAGDFADEPMLLVSATVEWRGLHGRQERTRRTLIYRSGLTRSGLFGSALGRAGPVEAAAPPEDSP
jgi:hypothetical protein